MKENLKKIGYLLVMMLWAMGLIGGAGYCIYKGAYPIALGCIVNAILAFPKVKEFYNDLMK